MPYSDSEIKVIHQQASAEFQRKYASLSGKTYVGTSTGRLRIIDESILELERGLIQAESDFANSLDIIENQVEENAIAEISSYFTLDLNAELTPEPYINEIKENNLFTLNTNTGELTPSSSGIEDTFFDLVDGNITPKVL
tara:strand:- start:93 stop:512 length:420 start_codon:yes stop_codon:yes gene_type:complete